MAREGKIIGRPALRFLSLHRHPEICRFLGLLLSIPALSSFYCHCRDPLRMSTTRGLVLWKFPEKSAFDISH